MRMGMRRIRLGLAERIKQNSGWRHIATNYVHPGVNGLCSWIATCVDNLTVAWILLSFLTTFPARLETLYAHVIRHRSRNSCFCHMDDGGT
jgi:hypothetical protein